MKKETVEYSCDYCGINQSDSPVTPHTVIVDGIEYAIDLCREDECDILSCITDIGRKVSQRKIGNDKQRRSTKHREQTKAIRAWWNAHHEDGMSYGRITKQARQEYFLAHPEEIEL